MLIRYQNKDHQMYRKLRLTGRSTAAKPQAIVVGLFNTTERLPAGYHDLNQQTGGAITAAIKRAECSFDQGSVTCLYPHKSVSRLYILGLGDPNKFDSQTVRLAGAKLVRDTLDAKINRLEMRLLAGVGKRLAPDVVGRALAEGMTLAKDRKSVV